MSAPAALAIAKVIYPETKRAPLGLIGEVDKVKSPYNNVLEAAMVGAMDAIPIVAGIAANLIAFLSIYDLFNETLIWLGRRACMEQDLTFEVRIIFLFKSSSSPRFKFTLFALPYSSSSPTFSGPLHSPWEFLPRTASRLLNSSV